MNTDVTVIQYIVLRFKIMLKIFKLMLEGFNGDFIM